MRKSAKKGFTLIELIIVIAILGILAAVLIPKVIGVKSNAQAGTNRANARQIQSALAQYFADNDAYPAALTNVQTVLTKNIGKVPKYKTGTSMILSYTLTPGSGPSDTFYTIKWDQDTGTDVDETNAANDMTPGTETNTLFK